MRFWVLNITVSCAFFIGCSHSSVPAPAPAPAPRGSLELSAVEAACLPFLTIDTRQAAEDLCYQRYKGSTGPGNLPLQCQDIIGGLEANSDEYEILIRQYSMCLAENGFTIVDSNDPPSPTGR